MSMKKMNFRELPLMRVFKLALLGAGLGAFAAPAQADMTLVRLTPEQYQRTIHEVFGPSIQLDANVVETGFRDQGLLAVGARKLTLTSAGLERNETLALQIAKEVVDPKRRATLIPCKPKAEDAADAACAGQFISRVGLHLFRRPLTDGEVKDFTATAAKSTQILKSFHAGLSAALVQMLVAPEFLFRVEHSEPDPAQPGKLRLDAYSRATRLAFFLWDSTPDEPLLASAGSGEIMTEAGLARQIDRMLASPKMEYGVRAFFADMLGFDDFATLAIDTNLYPKFTKNVEDNAREQTLRTVADHLITRNRDYRDLMTTRDTFLTQSLAAIYGVPLPHRQEMGGAVAWVPYQFPADDPHVGLLTQVSFLSLHSHPGNTSPTLRGKALRENLLCQRVPPPPGNVDFSIVQDTNNPLFKTVRQRLTAHRNNPVCAGCHRITDPIGLALEDFDAAGVSRSEENGAPIDASGDFSGKPFKNVVELAAILRDEPAVTSCVVDRAFSFGTARAPLAKEAEWLATVKADLTKNGVKWRDLVRRIALNPDFYTVPAPETQRADAQK